MPRTRLNDALNAYERYRISLKKGKDALRQDRLCGTRLLEVAGGNMFMDKIGDTIIEDLFIELGQTNSNRSLCNYHYALQGFFSWARKRSMLTMDPMEDRPAPSFSIEERRRLPVTMFPTLLDEAGNPRNRALFAGGIYLLSRQVELSGIRINDLNLDEGRVRVQVAKVKGRGNIKTDLMPITSEFDQELRRWLMCYQDMAGYLDPTWYLFPALTHPHAQPGVMGFPRGTGKPKPDVPVSKAHLLVNPVLKKIGWLTDEEKGEGMHTLRRAGARARFDVLRALGYDGALRQVQSLLHHAHASMTEHYIGLNLDRFLRDEQLIGKPMYPQLQDPNLVDLSQHRVDKYRPEDWETALPGFKIRGVA